MYYVFDIDHYCWLVYCSTGGLNEVLNWQVKAHEFYVGTHKKMLKTWPEQKEHVIIHTYYAFREHRLIDETVLIVGLPIDLRKYNRQTQIRLPYL